MTTDTTPQFVPDARPVPPIQLLNPNGVLADGAEPAMDDATVIESLRYMVYGRAFDVKSFSLQRQGKLGTFAPLVGTGGIHHGPGVRDRSGERLARAAVPRGARVDPSRSQCAPGLRCTGWGIRKAGGSMRT